MTHRSRHRAGREVRALVIDDSVTFGGAIISLADIVPDLGERGVTPFVVSGQHPDELARLFPDCSVEYLDIRRSWKAGGGGASVQRRADVAPGWLRRKTRAARWFAMNDLPAVARVARLCRRHEVDLVHLNNGVSFVPGILAAWILRLPVVIHYRGIRGKKMLASGLQRRLLHTCDAFIAISETVRRSLVEGGFPPERVHTIYNGVDLDRYHQGKSTAETRASLGVPPTALLAGNFARMTRIKGIKEFVTAWRRVVDALPDAHAILVGDESDADGVYLADVRRQVAETGLDEKITFTGFRADVPDLMHACDLVVHTGTYPEGFGRVIVEAWAAGRPIIASDRGAPRDIIRDGTDGYLVDPTDEVRLSERIVAVLGDPDLRSELTEAGQARASEFSTARCAEQIVALYDRVLSG